MILRRLNYRNVKTAFETVLNHTEPWRKTLLLLQIAEVTHETSHRLSAQLIRRVKTRLRRHPQVLVPYFEYLERRLDLDAALAEARQRANLPNATAHELTEIAKFHYLRNALARGDAYIESAKALDPSLPRIYEEEAWNQRARGNVHREVQAVEHLISLVADRNEKFKWEVWLGEALIRNGRYEEAWEYLCAYPKLNARDERLLHSAYCAALLGYWGDAKAAYLQFAPDGNGGADLLRSAHTQLYEFQRADEAARLLSALDDSSPTELLELAFLACIQLGELDLALRRISVAASRVDRAPDTKTHLAQLLELLNRPEEALSVYLSAEAHELNSLSQFRRSALLADNGEIQRAVTTYLGSSRSPKLIRNEAPDYEVDPSLPSRLLSFSNPSASHETKIEQLTQILRRASGESLRTSCSILLGSYLAKQNLWHAAWAAIRSGQVERLPWLPLTVRNKSNVKSTLGVQYSEIRETEPLHEHTVLYESSLGAATSCNPLAICLEMLRDPDLKDFLHVWSISPMAVIHPKLRELPNVVFVRKGSLGHFYYLAAAKYIVNNSTTEYEFSKREGQRYLNTWHGVPWKTMGRDNVSEPFAYGNIARNFLHADVVLCPDAHTRDVLSRGHDVDLLASSAFVIGGYPRNDLSINMTAEERDQIRGALGLRRGEHLVLYMPTWRGTFAQRNAAVQKVQAVAKRISAPGLKVAVRAHHYVHAEFNSPLDTDGVIYLPGDIDTNELLGAADAVVTDFSSVLFDAAAVGLPVVKYVEDLETYSAERGLYFDPSEVPGANATTIDKVRLFLLEAISDPESFKTRYVAETSRFGSVDDGQSAQRAIDLLFHYDKGSIADEVPPRTILISTGGLPPNGITQSARSLLKALDPTDYQPYLIPSRNSLDSAEPKALTDVRRFARVLPLVGGPAGTRMEREALQYFSTRRYVDTAVIRDYIRKSQEQESYRRFGKSTFYSAVDFSAYDAKNTAMINYGIRIKHGKRGIVFHNEMWKEIENKYPRLRASLFALDEMDFYASVSDGVRDYNAQSMHEHAGIPQQKHITIENTINVSEIMELADSPLSSEDSRWYQSEGAHACVVARLSPEKNHRQLLEALADSRSELRRPVKITCLGDGPLRYDLEHQISALGLGDLVRLRGQVPNPQAHLKASGAMLLPSLHEGQPLVILEALTIGTPVIATDTPGSRSVLHGGAFGPLVEVSKLGLINALHQISEGTLTDKSSFEPSGYTKHSLNMFLEAIDPGDASRIQRTQPSGPQVTEVT